MRPKGTPASCATCGTSYLKRKDRPTNNYCSQLCAASANKDCKACGVQFVGPVAQVYCSVKCRKSDYWKRKGREENRGHVQKVKAQKYGTATEDIDPVRLFQRDSWTCQLCGELIDAELSHPHPLAATIDHVVPLSKGGSHTWGNVQAAHFRCNNKKGTRTPEGSKPSSGVVASTTTSVFRHWKPNNCASCGVRCRGTRCMSCRHVLIRNPAMVCACGQKKRSRNQGCRSCLHILMRQQGFARRTSICQQCGKVYQRRNGNGSGSGGRRFCSRGCANAGYTRQPHMASSQGQGICL